MKTTMKKSVARILVLAMAICLMVSLAVPAAATAYNEKIVEAKKGVIQIDVVYVDREIALEQWITSGTGFLINEDTILTVNHVVNALDDSFYAETAIELSQLLDREITAEQLRSNLQLRVSVLRDVHIQATVKQASAEMDFAILTLEQPLNGLTPLALRKSSELKQTETVHALGFPALASALDDQVYYDTDDVTVTTGSVNKITRGDFGTDIGTADESWYRNVDIVEHSAIITGGNSGGPLVDANGNVVGINAVGNDVATINIAISLDPIMQTMDALGIEYTSADEPAPTEPAATEAPATEAPVATEAPATEAPTAAPTEAPTTVATEPPVAEKEEGGLPIILIVAAVAVVAVIIVVVVVMSKGKKKAAPAPAPAYAPPANGGFNAAPHTPVAGGYTAPMGAGETTVLGGGAGETTVLGRNVAGGTLVRKRTGETIAINADTFVIGRERKTSNYCIADNSSISRSHVTLSVRNGVTYLADMGAANGTFVNGVKAMPRQEIALKNGDKVTLADEEFEFRG